MSKISINLFVHWCVSHRERLQYIMFLKFTWSTCLQFHSNMHLELPALNTSRKQDYILNVKDNICRRNFVKLFRSHKRNIAILKYRKIPNISLELIDIFKRIFRGQYSRGLYLWELIFGGHFVLVSAYQDFKFYHYIIKISLF